MDSYGLLYAFLGKKFEDPVLNRPVYGMIYIADYPLCMSNKHEPMTIAIGKLTFSVTHPDPVNVTRVEFWVDGKIKAEVTKPPYNWTWMRPYFFHFWDAHEIFIVAVNRTGMEKNTGIIVWKLF